jgi:hypothetical protein
MGLWGKESLLIQNEICPEPGRRGSIEEEDPDLNNEEPLPPRMPWVTAGERGVFRVDPDSGPARLGRRPTGP